MTLVSFCAMFLQVIASHGHGGHHYNNQNSYGPGSLKSYRKYLHSSFLTADLSYFIFFVFLSLQTTKDFAQKGPFHSLTLPRSTISTMEFSQTTEFWPWSFSWNWPFLYQENGPGKLVIYLFGGYEASMIMFFFFFFLSWTTRMPITMLEEVQQDPIPQAMHVLLSEMLQKVPVCASWVLWEQSRVPLLQQLEDQGGRTQMPLKQNLLFTFLNLPFYCCYSTLILKLSVPMVPL